MTSWFKLPFWELTGGEVLFGTETHNFSIFKTKFSFQNKNLAPKTIVLLPKKISRKNEFLRSENKSPAFEKV